MSTYSGYLLQVPTNQYGTYISFRGGLLQRKAAGSDRDRCGSLWAQHEHWPASWFARNLHTSWVGIRNSHEAEGRWQVYNPRKAQNRPRSFSFRDVSCQPFCFPGFCPATNGVDAFCWAARSWYHTCRLSKRWPQHICPSELLHPYVRSQAARGSRPVAYARR